jgi:hypothetical protein
VDVDLNALEATRHGHRIIAASVIHQNDGVNQSLLPDLVIRLAQRASGIIRRHHHHDFFVAKHQVYIKQKNPLSSNLFHQTLNR